MKKSGFVLLETIIVICVLSVGLIYLYSSYAVILNNATDESFYNKANDVYLAYYMNKEFTNLDSNYAYNKIEFNNNEAIISNCSLASSGNPCSAGGTKTIGHLNNFKIKRMYVFHKSIDEVVKAGIKYFDGSTIKYLKSLQGIIDVDQDYVVIKTEYNGHYYFAFYYAGAASSLDPDYVDYSFSLLSQEIIYDGNNNKYDLNNFKIMINNQEYTKNNIPDNINYKVEMNSTGSSYIISFTYEDSKGNKYYFNPTITIKTIDRIAIEENPSISFNNNNELTCSGGKYKIYYKDGTDTYGEKRINCQKEGDYAVFTVTETDDKNITVTGNSTQKLNLPRLEITGYPAKVSDPTKQLSTSSITVTANGNKITSGYTISLEPEKHTKNMKIVVKYQGAEKVEVVRASDLFTNLSFDYNYTGGIQSFKPAYSGTYKLEVWGAQGGKYRDDIYGGYGGYATGNTSLEGNQTIYIVVGGSSGNQSAGYNGGGGAKISSGRYMGGGGGATHIATKTGLLSTLANDKDKILIVAGGGGGSYYFYVGEYNLYTDDGAHYGGFVANGGAGGGYIGNNGYSCNNLGSDWQVCRTSTSGRTDTPSKGGTQTAGGLGNQSNSNYKGTFGQGGNGTGDGTGGGGGFYGGGGTYNIANSAESGGGGSGYIGNTKLIDKHMYCYNCATSNDPATKTITGTNVSDSAKTDYAKTGAGYARITFITF